MASSEKLCTQPIVDQSSYSGEKNIANWENIFNLNKLILLSLIPFKTALFSFFQLNIYPTFGFTKIT